MGPATKIRFIFSNTCLKISICSFLIILPPRESDSQYPEIPFLFYQFGSQMRNYLFVNPESSADSIPDLSFYQNLQLPTDPHQAKVRPVQLMWSHPQITIARSRTGKYHRGYMISKLEIKIHDQLNRMQL